MELHVKYLLPEIILLVAASLATLLGLFKNDSTRKLAQWAALLGTLVAGIVSLGYLKIGGSPVLNILPVEWFTNEVADLAGVMPQFAYVTTLACFIGFLSTLAAWNMPSKADPNVVDDNYRGEFYGMMLFSLMGVAMIGKVNDLIWLFVVLELVSIPTYIMVATSRSQIVAQEAGVKYFFLGALAAAIFLFGFSYIYGTTGATRYADIIRFIGANGLTPLAVIGLLMVIVGVGYKIASVPLHFYAADVYQGAATPVTAFLAFAPKAAGIVAIISMLSLVNFQFAGSSSNTAIGATITVMAILTLTVGNVLALLQRNIKRILAYSSIAHSGYMLVGLASGLGKPGDLISNGVSAALFYLAAYAIMNLGTFAVLIYLQGKADAAEDIDDLAGVAKEHPVAAFALAICLFSLIGMPLTIGFFGKLYIIQAALANGHTILAIITVINAAIAAAYYLKIIAAMYLRDAWNPFTVRPVFAIKTAATLCTVLVLVFGVLPSALLTFAGFPADPARLPAIEQPKETKKKAEAVTPAETLIVKN